VLVAVPGQHLNVVTRATTGGVAPRTNIVGTIGSNRSGKAAKSMKSGEKSRTRARGLSRRDSVS